MNKQSATPESIALLKKNLKLSIQDGEELLANSEEIKIAIKSMPNSGDGILKFFSNIYELLSGSVSGMYDTYNGLLNMLESNNTYEKRFHMQFINLCQSEWCEYLLGQNSNGALTNVISDFNNSENQSIIGYLQDLQTCVKNLESKCNGQLRNMTAHYDKPQQMYNNLILLDNEDEYSRRVGLQMEVHQKILALINAVISSLGINASKHKPIKCKDINVLSLINDSVAKHICNRKDLKEAIIYEISNAWKNVESCKSLHHSVSKIEQFMLAQGYNTEDFNSLTSIIEMRWAVTFMKSDLACSINAYLNASSMLERSLVLRRVYMIEDSALTHLYGFSDNRRKNSIWSKLKRIPEFGENPLSEELENELIALTSRRNGNKRNLYTHYIEGTQFNTSARFTAFRNMNQIEELMRVNRLAVLCNKVDRYLLSLMNTIKESHDKRKQAMLAPIYKIKEMGEKQNNQSIIDLSDKILSMFTSIEDKWVKQN